MPTLLILRQCRQELHRRHIHDRLGQGPTLSIPSDTAHAKNHHSTSTVPVECNPFCFMVAVTTMVHSPEVNVNRLVLASTDPQPSHSRCRDDSPTRYILSEPDSVEDTPPKKDVIDQA